MTVVSVIATVVGVLALLLGTRISVDAGRDDGPAFGLTCWAMSVVFVAVAAVAVGMLGDLAANLAFAHHDHYRGVDLIALRDGAGQTATYVLGSGGSDTTEKFGFYWRSGGAEHLDNEDASDVTLFEDSARPYAVEFTGCDLSVTWVAGCMYDDTRIVELHVPQGSVRNRIDLNMNPR